MSAARQYPHPGLAREHVGQVVGQLLDAPEIHAFASGVAAYLEGGGFTGVAVLWRCGDDELQAHADDVLRDGDRELALRARAPGNWARDGERGRVSAWIEVQSGGDSIGLVCDGSAAAQTRVRG